MKKTMVPLRKAIVLTGLTGNTLRKYADNGTIPSIKTPSGQRLFDVAAWLGNAKRSKTSKTVLCYCRVSSIKQRGDLDRQVERMREKFPDAEIIKDIGSGLSFKRKGIRSLLERLMRGDRLKVVVTHPDRLARFGVDIFRFLIERGGGELVVLNKHVEPGREVELNADLLSILYHFSCRTPRQRSHADKAHEDMPDGGAEESVPEMVRSLVERLQRDSEPPKPADGHQAGALDGGGEADAPDIA